MVYHVPPQLFKINSCLHDPKKIYTISKTSVAKRQGCMDPIEAIRVNLETYTLKHNASLRDYSKHLEINPSTLSKILAKKRGIPKSHAIKIAAKIFDTAEEINTFIDAVLKYKSKKNDFKNSNKDVILEESISGDHFFFISQWEYFAILNILSTNYFNHDIHFISQSLNISLARTKFCLEKLKKHNLIIWDEGTIKRTNKKLTTPNNIISRALQLAHLEELEIAKRKISLDIELKDFQSEVFTVSKKDILKLKKIISKTYQTLSEAAEQSPAEEVYLFATQLIPLSNCEKVLQSKSTSNKKKGRYEN